MDYLQLLPVRVECVGKGDGEGGVSVGVCRVCEHVCVFVQMQNL